MLTNISLARLPLGNSILSQGCCGVGDVPQSLTMNLASVSALPASSPRTISVSRPSCAVAQVLVPSPTTYTRLFRHPDRPAQIPRPASPSKWKNSNFHICLLYSYSIFHILIILSSFPGETEAREEADKSQRIRILDWNKMEDEFQIETK